MTNISLTTNIYLSNSFWCFIIIEDTILSNILYIMCSTGDTCEMTGVLISGETSEKKETEEKQRNDRDLCGVGLL